MAQRLTILRAYQGFHPSLNVDRVVPVVPAGAYFEDFRSGFPTADWTAYNNTQSPPTNGSISRYDPTAITTDADGLHITATNLHNGTWKSGIMDTHGKRTWGSPVRIEVRARFPMQKAIWPSWWMLNTLRDWPTTGELDGVEITGDLRAYFTIHGDNPYNSGPNGHWQQGGNVATRR
jgi:beta-glucanase (GH16 family)